VIPPDPTNTKADAWATVAGVLERRHPDFPLASETAHRLAGHHAARLPAGYESVPIITGDDE